MRQEQFVEKTYLADDYVPPERCGVCSEPLEDGMTVLHRSVWFKKRRGSRTRLDEYRHTHCNESEVGAVA